MYYDRVSLGREKVMLEYSTTIKNDDFPTSLRGSFEAGPDIDLYDSGCASG